MLLCDACAEITVYEQQLLRSLSARLTHDGGRLGLGRRLRFARMA
jgi:hypothetical protein